MPAQSWKELTQMKDEELISAHDRKAASTDPGLNYYLGELRHRELMGVLMEISDRLKGKGNP